MAATLPVTIEQRETISRLVAHIKADCHVDEMKYALEEGNYQAALDSGNRAKAIKSNWKLATSLLALRAAPQLFGQLYGLRARMLGDRSGKRFTDVENQVPGTENHEEDHEPAYLVNQSTWKNES
jgi:hypothetical protein